MWRQFFRNRGSHCSHGPLGSAICRTQLTPNRHVASNAGHKNDAPALCAIGNHLFCRKLRGEKDAHDVCLENFFVRGEVVFEKSDMAVDTRAWNADVQCVVEVGAELSEAVG